MLPDPYSKNYYKQIKLVHIQNKHQVISAVRPLSWIYIERPRIGHHTVHICPAFCGSYSTYPQKDGQAELRWEFLYQLIHIMLQT